MLKRIKEDSELGLQMVKKGIRNLIQRSLEEAESLKTRLEIRRKEKEFDEMTLGGGKMLFEKLQKGDVRLEDPDLKKLFLRTAQVKEDLDVLRIDLADRLNPISEEPRIKIR